MVEGGVLRREPTLDPTLLFRIEDEVREVALRLISNVQFAEEVKGSDSFHHPMHFESREFFRLNNLLCVRESNPDVTVLVSNKTSDACASLKLQVSFEYWCLLVFRIPDLKRGDWWMMRDLFESYFIFTHCRLESFTQDWIERLDHLWFQVHYCQN